MELEELQDWIGEGIGLLGDELVKINHRLDDIERKISGLDFTLGDIERGIDEIKIMLD